MVEEITIKLNIEFPEYEDMKSEIKECKRKWDEDDFTYTNEVTYNHLLCNFPGGYFRIYASDDTGFKPTFDDMRGGYLHSGKKFELNKKGYAELFVYAMYRINGALRV